MNNRYNSTVLIYCILWIILLGCTQNNHEEHTDTPSDAEPHEAEEVHLSAQQIQALNLKMGPLTKRNLSTTVDASGRLEVPPQNEAAVTSMIGANIKDIQVIEGDPVKKGQVLAYLEHPALIRLQMEYMESWNNLQYLTQEFERQQKLYEAEVGSGRAFQKTKADYETGKAHVKGLAGQLKLLGLNLTHLQKGEIYQSIPVVSPIQGNVQKINVKTGRYVDPQVEMFEIVNTEHVHADLMVFEKDVYKVHAGQKVRFSVQSIPEEEMEASIYAVGVSFENEPKAVHIHAEIENKKGNLLPGMYVKGYVLVDSATTYAMPEEAVVREGERYYLFTAESKNTTAPGEWIFQPVEIMTGIQAGDWIEVRLLEPADATQQFLLNNAYYIQAEMTKGEGEHHH